MSSAKKKDQYSSQQRNITLPSLNNRAEDFPAKNNYIG